MSSYTPPPCLLPWLNYQLSLIDKLKSFTPLVNLEVLQHEWEMCNTWDIQTLQLKEETVLHREILVRAGEKPCWYARTIIPWSTYFKAESFFMRLEHEPLGHLIHHNPAISRKEFQYYAIAQKMFEYQWIQARIPISTPILWGRLSTFEWSKIARFYLVEVFLPDLVGILN